LAQGLSALQVGIDLGFEFTDDGEAAVDFGDYPSLRRQVRQKDRKRSINRVLPVPG